MSRGIRYTLGVSLLVGLSFGTADAQEAHSNQTIQQVVGKQPGGRRAPVQQAAVTGQTSGILGRLMTLGRGGDDRSRTAPQPSAQREPADWTGVPYHEVPAGKQASSRRRSAPVSAPGSARTARSTKASSAPRSAPANSSALGPIPTPPSMDSLHVPTGKDPVIEVGDEPESFSATFSSRRNGRRNVQPLEADAPKPSAASTPSPTAQADKEPRVASNRSTKVARSETDTEPGPKSASTTSSRRTRPSGTTAGPAPGLAAGPQAGSTATEANTAARSPRATEASAESRQTPRAHTPPSLSRSTPAPATGGEATAAAPQHPQLAAPELEMPTAPDVPTLAGPASASPSDREAADNALMIPSPTAASSEPTAASPEPAAEPAPATVAGNQALTLTPADMVAAGQRASAQNKNKPTTAKPNPASGDRDNSVATTDAPIGSGVAQPGTETPGGQIKLHATADGTGQAASASGGSMQPRTSSPAADTVAAEAAEVPGLRVIAEGPSQIMIRQNTTYEIRVENRGAVAAPGVLVRTAIPGWIGVRSNAATRGDVQIEQDGGDRHLLWRIEKLPAGKTERLSLEVQAERAGSFGVAVDWTLLPQTNNLMVHVREPKLQLLIEGPDQVVFGESETYKVRVLNPGDGLAPNVTFTLSPNSATPQTQSIGAIPPGKEAHFNVELTAQDLGDLQIHGLATADLQLRSEAAKTIRVAAAQLEAILTGPPLRYQNGEASYKLTLENTGAAASRNVAAKLQLPSGIQYVDGMQGVQQTGQTLQWTIDELAPGASRDYEFRCQLNETGAHHLAFECQGSAAGQAAVSLTTKVEALADLVLAINDPPAPAPTGQAVTYELNITNRGSKAAADVHALAHFSDHIEPERVEGHSGKVSVGQVLLDPIARIEPGQTVTVRIVAKAMQEGHHRFRAEVSCGETILVAEEATRYMSPVDDQISRRSSETSAR